MFLDNNFDLYLYEQFLIEKRNLAPITIATNMTIMQSFLIKCKDVYDLDEYNNYIIEHSIRKRTASAYTVLKNFIEFKIEDSGTRANMIEHLIKPEIKSTRKVERKYLDEGQIIDLINNMNNTKHKIIALIQDLTGVRAGDVIRIKRGDIQPEIYEGEPVLKIIITGKGNKRNVVFIHDEVIQTLIISYIIEHFISPEYYFQEDKTRQYSGNHRIYRIYRNNYRAYIRDMKQSMYKIGLNAADFATHDYRRCYARRVWTKYKDLQILQKLLNHVNPITTMAYLNQSGLQNIDYHKEMQLR